MQAVAAVEEIPLLALVVLVAVVVAALEIPEQEMWLELLIQAVAAAVRVVLKQPFPEVLAALVS
jgi:hypothetical protein